jgi:hypothetical protein
MALAQDDVRQGAQLLGSRRWENYEVGNWGRGNFGKSAEKEIFAVESRHQATTSEELQDFLFLVVTVSYEVCNSVKLL